MNNVKTITPSHRPSFPLRFERRIGKNGSVETMLQQLWIPTEFAEVDAKPEWRDVELHDLTKQSLANN